MIDLRENTAKEVIGEYITNHMKENKITILSIEKKTGLKFEQVKGVMSGYVDYTMTTFLKVIAALDLYLFFANKEDAKDNDLDNLVKKGIDNDPMLRKEKC